MKKSIALVAMAFGVSSAFAQDLTSKKGEPFLPEAGDYAIGVDATPFLNYFGNFFGKTANNTAPTFDFANSNFSISGKKFKDANNAYRASLNIGLSSQTTKYAVSDRSANVVFPAVNQSKENVWKQSQTEISVSLGLEKRRGKTRLQGVYGAEAALGLNSASDKYTYGNALRAGTASKSYADEIGVDFEDGMNQDANLIVITIPDPNPPANNPDATIDIPLARATEVKSGVGFLFGVRGFVGAEYFVAPKISIGGEFGWGLGLGIAGAAKATFESIGDANADPLKDPNYVVGTQEFKGSKTSFFGLNADNTNTFFGPSASLRLNLHF